MGKGNRNRQERAEEQVLNPQKYVKKKQVPAFVGPLLVALIALLLVVVLVGNTLIGAGVFMRARTAAESDDFKVDGAMMSYYVHSSYTSYVNYYYEMYTSMLSSSSSSIDVYSLMGIDPNISLKKQIRDEESGETWYDYFAELAVSQIEEQLVYAQAAKQAGVSLDDEDYAAIDESIETVRSYADTYGTSLNNYLALNYGKGVREKDVRRVMELLQLSSKYAQMVNDDLLAASTDDKVNAFYEENKNDYHTADYLSYKLTAVKDETLGAEEADAQYASDKQKIGEAADKLVAMTSEQEFKDYIKSYFATGALDAYMAEHYEKYLAEAEGETDEEKAAAAEQKVKDKVAEDAEAEVEDLLTEKFAYTVDTDLGAWIFGKDDAPAAKANTGFKVVDDAKDAEGTYTINVYFLTREASRNEATTRSFTYLLLENTEYTAEDAQEALTKFESGEKTSEALIALGESYEDKATCTSMEEIALGETGVDELDAWMYTEDRKAGDYTLLTYTYEDATFHILVLVDEIGPAEWYVDCRDAQVAEEMADWFEEATKTYVVTVNEKAVNKVNM